MIQIDHDNVLELNGLLSSIDLPKKKIKELAYFKKIKFTIFDYTDTVFLSLLKETLGVLLESYKIHLIYIESKAQQKNKIRSFKKMFYNEKKKGILKTNELYEAEIEVNSTESLMVGSIKVSDQNIEYILSHLMNSNFRFGYLVKKDKRSFTKNRDSFFEDVIKDLDPTSKITRVNFIELLISQVKKNKNVFRIPYTVNDKEFIEFIIREDDKEINENLLKIEQKYKETVEN